MKAIRQKYLKLKWRIGNFISYPLISCVWKHAWKNNLDDPDEEEVIDSVYWDIKIFGKYIIRI